MNPIKAQLIDDLSSINQKRKRSSKLDPFRYEILMMNNELNCSLNTIRLWLKSKQNIEISTTAIHKRLLIWKQFDKGVSLHDTQE